jgi:BirA family transcriptional regulator, biotin operon repressor / biotin---[acetyl-CoA-carboxylase] ligase
MANCADLSHGAVVFTRYQTAGRGQWGRSWVAPAGVLTASFVLRPLAPDPQSTADAAAGYLSLLAGLAVIQALERFDRALSPQLQIKWPNDVWLAGRKLAGILVETGADGVVVGIGLNRQVDFGAAAWAERAISLHQVSADVPSDRQLLTRLRSELLDLAAVAPSPEGLLSSTWIRAINQRDLLRDRTVTVQQGTETIVGIGQGIDWQGGYQLRLPDGTVRSLRSGQIQSWA